MSTRATKFTGLAVIALLGGCVGDNLDALSIPEETWILTDGQVNGQPLDIAGNQVTLSFVDGEAIVGNGAVNNYRVPVRITGGQIEHTGPLITTRMAGPIPAMQLESAYLSALGEAQTVQRSGNTLTITGDDDVLNYTLTLEP